MSSIVGTMKSLAAVNIRVFGRATEALGDYTETIERALQVLLADREPVRSVSAPLQQDHPALIVFGAVRGMCAQFTDHIADHAAELAGELPNEPAVVAVGPRVGPMLSARGLTVSDTVEMYGALEQLPRVVDDCLVAADRLQARGATRILLCYNRHAQPSYEPHHRTLLPVDPGWLEEVRSREWPTNQIPALMTPGHGSLTRVLRELLFSTIYQAAAESLAGENAARLASMQSAESNLDERLSELHQEHNRQRQQEITSELLDIVSGYTALRA